MSANDNTIAAVTLSEIDKQQLRQLFPDLNPDNTANVIANLAFAEWMAWLSGSKRYGSQTEEMTERIIDIYAELTPDKEPNVSTLYNRFGIPFGRARYVCQVIESRHIHALNQQAIIRLLNTLEVEQARLNGMGQEEVRQMPSISFEVDKRGAQILLSLISDQVSTNGISTTLSIVSSPFPDRRRFKLSPRELSVVLEIMRATQQ